MSRVLVAHNWHLALDPYALAEGKPYPPVGTAVLAAMLREQGHDVRFYDPTFAPGPEVFATALDLHRPELVLIVPDDHSVPQKMCLEAQREAGFAMVRLARERGARVAVSGPDATDRPHGWLQAGAEVAFRGEPDEPLVAWCGGAPATSLPGAFTSLDQPLTERAAPMKDLSRVPSPAWDLVDLGAYRRTWQERHGLWEAPVTAARGCPYRCNWCAKPVWGRSLALRPAEAVVADARELGARGADRIWFMDDIFALKRAWLREFRAEVERQGGIPPYRCLSRADLLVRDAHVEDLAATGCVEVWMGAESGSQKVLDAMDKDQDVREIGEATRLLRARGIRVGFFLQLGYPGEELGDVRETLAMIRRLMPDEIGISVSYPLPGTPFFERVRAELSDTNWQTAMDNRVLFRGTYPQPFYDAARQAIRHEHAARLGLSAARRLVSGQPDGIRRDLRRTLATAVHAPRVPFHHLQMRWHARAKGTTG